MYDCNSQKRKFLIRLVICLVIIAVISFIVVTLVNNKITNDKLTGLKRESSSLKDEYTRVLNNYHMKSTDKFNEGESIFSADENYKVSTKDADGKTCLSLDQFYFGKKRLEGIYGIYFNDLPILKVTGDGNTVYTRDNGNAKYIIAFKGKDGIKLMDKYTKDEAVSFLVYSTNIEYVKYGDYVFIFCTITA